MHGPSASVLIALVTYNSAGVLPGLFERLPAAMAEVDTWQLVVADNDSADDTVGVVRRLAPEALIVEMGRNAGYAAGINAAVASGRSADAVLVTNPDVRPQAGSVRRLLDVLGEHPEAGIAVPQLRDADGSLITSLRREPSVLRALGEAVVGARRAGRVAWAGEVVMNPLTYQRPGSAAWASGTFMLITKECLSAVGPWDESFFLYSEETDFSLRARDKGFALRYTPEAVVTHLEGDSKVSSHLYSLLTVNRAVLFARRHGPIRSRAFLGALLAKEMVRSVRPAPTHRAALRALLVSSSRPAEVGEVSLVAPRGRRDST